MPIYTCVSIGLRLDVCTKMLEIYWIFSCLHLRTCCDIMQKNMDNRIVGENRGTRNERLKITHLADPVGYLRGGTFGRFHLAWHLAAPAISAGCLGGAFDHLHWHCVRH